jgi:tetratricopeptide (TPR) repeat protein
MRSYRYILCLLLPLLTQGQEIDTSGEYRKIDSVKAILTDENVKENLNNYIKLITFYARRHIDTSKIYVEKYLKISEGSVHHFDAIGRKVYILQLEQKYDEAISLIQQTIKKDSATIHKKENKYALLKLYTNLAEIYTDQEALEKALEIYYKSTAIYENEGIVDDITYYLNLYSIAALLTRLKYYDRALSYSDRLEKLLSEKLASIQKQSPDYTGLIYLTIHNYIGRASMFEERKKLPEAIENIQKAERLATAEKQYRTLPKIYAMLGRLYNTSEKYDEAIASGLQALELEKLYNYPEYRDSFLGIVGRGYLGQKEYKKAMSYLEKALKETTAETRKIPLLRSLAEAYQETKNYEKANTTLLLMNKLKDTFYTKNKEEAIAEITEKYENEKSQREIELLQSEKALQELKIEQQSYVIYGIIGLVILLCILGSIWYQNWRQQQKLKEAILSLDKEKLQQRFLRTQLNPHFFFHALAAIESYIYKEDKEAAAEFLQKFGALMRSILESSDIDFIPLETDINFIEKYLTLQSLNTNASFTYTINIADELNRKHIMIPPMLIQPFVENAILHGVSSVENGHIAIDYFKEDTNLMITITDNGKGVKTSPKKSEMLHRSMSSDIIKQRIENIQKVHGMEIQYTISSTENTKVSFIIPIQYGNFKVA